MDNLEKFIAEMQDRITNHVERTRCAEPEGECPAVKVEQEILDKLRMLHMQLGTVSLHRVNTVYHGTMETKSR